MLLDVVVLVIRKMLIDNNDNNDDDIDDVGDGSDNCNHGVYNNNPRKMLKLIY